MHLFFAFGRKCCDVEPLHRALQHLQYTYFPRPYTVAVMTTLLTESWIIQEFCIDNYSKLFNMSHVFVHISLLRLGNIREASKSIEYIERSQSNQKSSTPSFFKV